MQKKCIICGEKAEFFIKDTNTYYCKECAKEHFKDISYLKKVEEQAKELKKKIEEKIEKQEDEKEGIKDEQI
ncbi:hypothetical protein GF336_07670 [Candidatus Woesearchaeota archaeon]|nr:hypothetical protein [Candidatus Woesearchaeota archaeon]